MEKEKENENEKRENERLKKDALEIFRSAIRGVDSHRCVSRNIKLRGSSLFVSGIEYDLTTYENIYVIGFGKASARMARAIEDVLGELITDGIVVVKYGYSEPLRYLKLREGGHPVPDEGGLRATLDIESLLKKTGENDLIIVLISGGGSSLLCLPRSGITLDDKIKTTKALLKSGATIHEINTIRKHMSKVKGGGLAKMAYPSDVLSLIISDVVGDNLDVIASGPLVADSTTFSDCMRIIEKYGLDLPLSVIELFKAGIEGKEEETVKPKDEALKKVRNVVVGNNRLALESAQKRASELGYNTLILTTYLVGESREVAKVMSAIAREEVFKKEPIKLPVCILAGGETTVTI